MSNKVILSCAVTVAGDTTSKSPHVPVTPKEIAESAIKAAKAVVIIAQVHARDPGSGSISYDVYLYKEIVERIRVSETVDIINITSGGGGDAIPDEENP